MKAPVPTRLKRGIDFNPLGAGIDAFYIACENDSYLIGKVELPSKKGLVFVPSEEISGERFIARWASRQFKSVTACCTNNPQPKGLCFLSAAPFLLGYGIKSTVECSVNS